MKTKKKKVGPVGVLPFGDWDGQTKYPLLAEVVHDHDSWYSKVADNIGHEPSDNSEYWKRGTRGGKHAYEEGETAKQKGNTAAEQGNIAEQKGNTAKQKGDDAEGKGNVAEEKGNYAKAQGDRCKVMADHRDKLKPDGYIYTYDPENESADAEGYVKTDQYINTTLDISQLTEEQKQELVNLFVLDFATETECRSIVTNYGQSVS